MKQFTKLFLNFKDYNDQAEEEDEQERQIQQDNRNNNNNSASDHDRTYQDEDDENELEMYNNKSEPQLNYFNNHDQKIDLNEDNQYDEEYNEQEYKQYQIINQNVKGQNDKKIEQKINMQNYLEQSDEDIERINENQKYLSEMINNNEQYINETPQQLNKQKRIKKVGETASAPHSLTIAQVNKQQKNYIQNGIMQHSIQNDCQFCEWKIRRIKFLRENLHIKYFETFNFYFAKPINEILANYNLPHVIMLKDFQYFQDENEYLKRYYRVDEVPPRLAVLTNFFTNSYKQTRPNLIVTNQHRVISKRNFKQARLFMRQVAKNVNNGIGYNANNNLYNKDDSSDSDEYSSDKNESNQKDNNSKGNKKKTNLPSRVLHSHLSQTIPLSQNQSQTGEQSISSNAHEYDNYRNFIMQMSFETSTHDIYYPSFSTSNKGSEIAQNISNKAVNMNNNQQLNFKKQEKNQNNYEEDYKSSFDEKQGFNINNEYLKQQKASYFDKRELNMIEQHLGLNRNKKENSTNYGQESEEINPHLLNLIIGAANQDQNQYSQSSNQKYYEQQDIEKNYLNINQIIDLMQSQQQNNYLNMLDIHASQSENLDPGSNNVFEINRNYNNQDPSMRINTLISQSNSTQMSHINTFNANNYIIGSNSNKISNTGTIAPKQNTLKFEKQQLAELQLGSPVLRNVTSLNNEGRSSGTSLQPIFSNREEINYINTLLQSQDNNYSHNQQPLRTQDLQSNNNQIQGNLNKEEIGLTKLDQKPLNSSQKSIQQVQKYILSQIKKQHDCINMVRNQQGVSSISSSQHPIYTSLSPEQKDKKETSSNLQKTLKKIKGNNINQKELNHVQGKQKYLGQNENYIPNNSRKQLNERNFTEVNLGSVFERLMLSNRLASQESKKNIANESNNLEIYIQKVANSSLSRNNSIKKKQSKQGTTQRSNLVTSSDISPLGYTPRDFTLKNQIQKNETSNSLKYLHTEQSPDQNRKAINTNNMQLGNKKNSLSHNQLNSNSSMKNIGNQNKPREQSSLDNRMTTGQISASPSQQQPYKNQIVNPKTINSSVNAQMTTTVNHSSPDNNSLITSMFKDSHNIKSNTNPNKRIHSISNIRNKIINAGEQKSSLNSPSRICTDRESKNPRLKQNKSPSLTKQGCLSNVSRKKTNQKRVSNSKIYSPNSYSYQKQTPNSVLNNNYYQRGEENGVVSQLNQNNSLNVLNNNWNQQESYANSNIQQQQYSENSNSNLQMQLIQQPHQGQMTSNINANNQSSNTTIKLNQHGAQYIQQNQKHNEAQSLTQSQNNTNQQSQRGQNKTISQRILTNALTNTINKFYKNIIKNLEQENQKYNSPNSNLQTTQRMTSPQQQNRKQTTISPLQNQQSQQNLQATASPDNQYSPRLISSQVQNYQQEYPKKYGTQTQTRQQGRIKTNSSEEMTQKIIKNLCLQKTKLKDSTGSSNQISYNLDILNSARTSSITKGQENRGNSENMIYGNGGLVNAQTINNAKKKQMQIRQKGNQKINNQATTNINGLINNQSINSSIDNINLQNTNFISNVTNNGTLNMNSNNFLSNQNYNSKVYNNTKSINPSNYNSKANAQSNQSNQVVSLNSNLSSSQIANIQSNNNLQNFQKSLNNQHLIQQQQKQFQNQQQQSHYQLQQQQIDLQNQQKQYQQWQNIIQQQTTQNQPIQNHQNIQDYKQVHHTHLESVKSNNTPRQSKQRIKPPSSQLSNNSQLGTSKAVDYRAVKTEAPLLTEESQLQNNTFFKNILNHDTSNSGIILSQQQLISPDLNPIHQYLQNSKIVQQQNINGNYINQNNSSQNTHLTNNPQNKSSSTSSTIKNTLSPVRSADVKKKIPNKRDENQTQMNQQQILSPVGDLQLLAQLATSKKRQEEIQLGNGFYTQRNTGKQRKKSNDLHGSNQKYIQSSRGSYQGHYSDLSAWKHASLVNQNQNVNYLQQQNIPIQNHESYQKDAKQLSQQYNTLLNTSPIRQQQQQQQSQSHIYQQQQSKQQAIYQPQTHVHNQMSQTPLTQQQTAGLINHKIKQLSQKFLMQ